MSLIKWSPFRPAKRVSTLWDFGDELERLLERPFGWRYSGFTPAVDLLDRGDHLTVKAELPGLDKKDIHVSLEDDVLTIRGELKRDKEVKEEDYYCCERSYGSFARSISLPTRVEAEETKASYKDGVLEINLTKAKEARPKEIEVKVA
ncbi:MAG: Hsp20/alpha crystallin family protein [bacterium]